MVLKRAAFLRIMLAIAATTYLTGCMSIANWFDDEEKFYGGARENLQAQGDVYEGAAGILGSLWLPALYVDLPCSCVADTLAAPVTVWLD